MTMGQHDLTCANHGDCDFMAELNRSIRVLAQLPPILRDLARLDRDGTIWIKESGCDMGLAECPCERPFVPQPTGA